MSENQGGEKIARGQSAVLNAGEMEEDDAVETDLITKPDLYQRLLLSTIYFQQSEELMSFIHFLWPPNPINKINQVPVSRKALHYLDTGESKDE